MQIYQILLAMYILYGAQKNIWLIL